MKNLFPETKKRYFTYWRTGNGVTRHEVDAIPGTNRIESRKPREKSHPYLLTPPCESETAHESFEELVNDDAFMESRFDYFMNRNPECGLGVAI